MTTSYSLFAWEAGMVGMGGGPCSERVQTSRIVAMAAAPCNDPVASVFNRCVLIGTILMYARYTVESHAARRHASPQASCRRRARLGNRGVVPGARLLDGAPVPGPSDQPA